MPTIKIPNGYLLVGGPSIQLGKYYFEMHDYLGPLRLRKNGEPANSEFPPDFWPLFEKWKEDNKND